MGQMVQIPEEFVSELMAKTANIELDHINLHTGTSDNPELTNFASRVFRILHWYGSPGCQANHPSWNPES